jgi:hypothetical protein
MEREGGEKGGDRATKGKSSFKIITSVRKEG